MTSKQPRWEDSHGISDLSVALDEIYALRGLLAREADIIAAHLELKSFPKSRREYAKGQIDRMRTAARGDFDKLPHDALSDLRKHLANAGAKETLTNWQWATQRGLHKVTNGEDKLPLDEHIRNGL